MKKREIYLDSLNETKEEAIHAPYLFISIL